jgi:hypothetical protein
MLSFRFVIPAKAKLLILRDNQRGPRTMMDENGGRL